MSVRYIDIQQPDDVGQRLDNFLMRQVKGVPRSMIYRIVRKGEVRVNGGRVAVSYRLALGDKVRLPPIRQSVDKPLQPNEDLAQKLLNGVLFEDDNLLVLNKPFGVAVHGGSNIRYGVVETLRLHYGNDRLELIHRLDRDTSGCLALAKNRRVLKELQAAFRERQVKKLYDLMVWGNWPRHTRTVQKKLQRYTTAWGERRVRVSAQGQSARTDFDIVESGTQATWLQARIHTGRTHQIRVHAQASGHSIVGDTKYADPDHGRSPPVEVARLCLHARKLVLPYAGSHLKLHAAVPSDMHDIWRQIDQRDFS
ncbi:MAG: RluA family pseudouridine synthase [Pseudomonadota bacterium]